MMKVLLLAASSLMLHVGEAAEACHDVTAKDVAPDNASESVEANNIAKCARNVMWAMTTGIKTKPEFYTKFDNLTAASSFGDFQCALWKLTVDGSANSTGHECLHPCSKQPLKYKDGSDLLCEGTGAHAAAADAANNGEAGKGNEGRPWWAWLLVFIGICCALPCCGLLCSAFLCYESVACIFGKSAKPAKKKRALKKTIETPAPAAPTARPTPVATTTVPMPVYTSYAAPVTTAFTTAPPVYLQAAPAPTVSYAAPAVTCAAPATSVQYSAPAVTYAAPAASASYLVTAEPVTTFDMIDAAAALR
jgi:hypothetical protein